MKIVGVNIDLELNVGKRKYLKFGADIVVGHHPHVPQNYEQIGDKII